MSSVVFAVLYWASTVGANHGPKAAPAMNETAIKAKVVLFTITPLSD